MTPDAEKLVADLRARLQEGEAFYDKAAEDADDEYKEGYCGGAANACRWALSWLDEYAWKLKTKCPKCNGTGMADTGGITPWGAPIEVPCECKSGESDQDEC